MDTIFIQQLKVDTIIGVYEHERTVKQPLIIDLQLDYDISQAAASDNLKYALDYHQLSIDIHQFVSESSYQLIEALAEALAKRILKNNAIKKVDLTISKPQALDLAQNVGIRINRSQKSYR